MQSKYEQMNTEHLEKSMFKTYGFRAIGQGAVIVAL